MKKQKIGKFHQIIKKIKHGLDEEDVLNTNKFLEANIKYLQIMEKTADILIYIFSPAFLIFLGLLYIPFPGHIEKWLAGSDVALILFFASMTLFVIFLSLKIKIRKFKRYVQTKNDDKDIDY